MNGRKPFTPFLLLYLFFLTETAAQNNQLIFQHYTIENGLSNNSVRCITQDDYGYIWIGTANGLNRFDGYTSLVFRNDDNDSGSIPDNSQICIFKDHRNRIWTGGVGASVFDYASGNFTNYQLDKNNPKSIVTNDVAVFAEDENNILWIGTRLGLVRFDEKNKAFTNYTHDRQDSGKVYYRKNRVTDLLPDKHGHFWVGTLDGLYKFSIATGQFINVSINDAEQKKISNSVYSITFDESGKLWAAIDKSGIRVLDTLTNQFTTITAESTHGQLSSNDISNIICDRSGNIWIAHAYNGLNVYDSRDNTFKSIRHDEFDERSLVDDKITTLFQDKSGMIWIGTDIDGTDRLGLTPQKFETYIMHPGKHGSLCERNITSACEDAKGNIWLGSSSGLIYFDRASESFSCYYNDPRDPNSLSHNAVHVVRMDQDGTLWVGTQNGLNHFDPQKGKWKRYFKDSLNKASLPINTIFDLAIRSNGDVWIGPASRPARYIRDGDYFDSWLNNEKISSLVPEFYVTLFEDSKKNMWYSMSRFGVYELDGSFNVIHKYVHDRNSNSIPGNKVNDFAEDHEGNIWMATNNGLCKLDVRSQRVTNFSDSAGLSSSAVHTLKIAPDHSIWIGTDEGITGINFDASGKMHTRKFNKADGLQSNSFNNTASLKLRSGEILFGGIRGFTIFRPEKISYNPFVPQVQLSSFTIFDKALDIKALNSLSNNIPLDYAQNFFSFDMAALSYDHPENNHFAYQLEGFDDEMIYCGTRHHVSYTNVPPGVYQLHILASNNDGVWNKEGFRVQIGITPPYWKTWWFRAGTLVLLITVFTLFVRYISTRKIKKQLALVEQQREIENIRSRISRDIHDDIGAGLTRISMLSETMKTGIHDKSHDIPVTLDKIISSSREITGNLSEIVWTVNPQYDNLESLLSYMRHYINNYFEDADVSCIIRFPEEVLSLAIHPDIKRNLFMLLKESLNNAMKHAQAKYITVTFISNEMKYSLIIGDDGIGMEEGHQRKFGNGFRNMQMRTESIHASYHIQTAPQKGTVITIEGRIFS